MIHRKLLIVCAITFNAFIYQAQTAVFLAKPAGGKTWGYAGINGEFIIPAQFEKCYEFSPVGLAIVYEKKSHQHYLIDLKNQRKEAEKPEFKIRDGFGINVSNFQNGLLLVKIGNKWGYMNTEGKMAIPAVYDSGNDFNGGFAAVRKGDNLFVLDPKGKESPIDKMVMDVGEFSEGLAPVSKIDGKSGFVNEKGELVIPMEFESVGAFVEGLAWAKTTDRKVGYIDKKGKWVIEPKFEVGKEFDAKSGLARIKQDNEWGYVNKKGEILAVFDTESWGDFSEGLAEGKKGTLHGFYDNKGNWAIAPQFEDVRKFQNGYAAAKLNGKWGIIDKTGKWVIEPKFDAVKDVILVK